VLFIDGDGSEDVSDKQLLYRECEKFGFILRGYAVMLQLHPVLLHVFFVGLMMGNCMIAASFFLRVNLK